MILKDKIFRAYDIRGEAFVDFDEDGFFILGQAFAQYLREKFKLQSPKIFVSGDGRQSMPELFPALISGLKGGGAEVCWGDTIPTPMNYFAFHHGDFDGAMQISASHNPAQDNGLKLTDKSGAVSGEEIQKLKALAQCQSCRDGNIWGEEAAACENIDIREAYLKKIKNITPDQSPIKVLIDAGNAIPGLFYPNFFQAFGHETHEIFCDLNTTFPNHQPDPERPENLVYAQEKIGDVGADLAFVYDGDGDRVGIILQDKTALSADKILYVLACDFLTRNPKAPIVVDAMSSQTLINKLSEKGAQVILSQTGHSHIEHAMVDNQALLGGEQSGHFMFGENFYGHDDAMLASLRFIQAIQTNPKLIEEVTTLWPNMLEVSERITVPDESKFDVIEEVTTELKKEFPDASTLDGIRLNFGHGEWAIIRASNTSPKIAVRIEANSEDSLEEKKNRLMGKLKQFVSP